MTAQRNLVALLPPGTDADVADTLVAATAALAASAGAALDIVDLRGPDASPPAAALAAPARWWRVHHAAPARVDADSVLALVRAALQRIGGDHGSGGNITAGTLFVLPAGNGEEVAVRLAAQCGGVALGRVADLAFDGKGVVAQRAGWGGHVQMTLVSHAPVAAACWRPARAGAAARSHAPQVQAIAIKVEWPVPSQTEPVDAADARPALEGARLVVSGGRGMQGEAGFAQLAHIADHLGAALGGSLPAVDAGWVPVARQIGQSGKFVGPRTYFAVGISGTPQHLAGVSRDSRVIAVNKDAQAPIFGVAEVGVVADWQLLLPALARELAALKSDGSAP